MPKTHDDSPLMATAARQQVAGASTSISRTWAVGSTQAESGMEPVGHLHRTLLFFQGTHHDTREVHSGDTIEHQEQCTIRPSREAGDDAGRHKQHLQWG